MDASKSVTAHFKPDVTLTLAKQGVGDLNPVEGTYTFIRDHVASVSASPANGFDHWHGLSEEYSNIAYSVQYSGKTAIVRDFRSYLNVDSDFGTVDYTDMHRYEYGSSEFTSWQAMGPVSGGAGHPTTVYKLGSMGANGAYISPVNLTGVADISNIIMTLPEGNQPALTIANSQVDRSIP